MKRREIYLEDSYRREHETRAIAVKDSKFVVLDSTIFYPEGGGQPHDRGEIISLADGARYPVVYVGKFDGNVSHEIDSDFCNLKEGDRVRCVIDWERRYKLMRSHTAAHLVSAIINQRTGALITGNQLDIEKVRIDFSLEKFERDVMKGFLDYANEIIKQDLPVRHYYLSREEAEREGVSLLAKGLPPDLEELRVVEIEGIDRQADGGTHVRHLSEIGEIELLKLENKGKKNRRVYFKLV
ncbi:MAG: alanine--tRNA ligase-related protein [Candidatus Syntropharchaeales archaeon]